MQPDALRRTGFHRLALGLPDAEPRLSQPDGQFHFHLASALVRHGVVDLIKLGHQAHAIVANEAVGLDAGLVLVEANIGIEPGHADIHERLAELVVRVGLAKTRLVPHGVGELDDVDAVVMLRTAGHGWSVATEGQPAKNILPPTLATQSAPHLMSAVVPVNDAACFFKAEKLMVPRV